jgi:hypothetical protein
MLFPEKKTSLHLSVTIHFPTKFRLRNNTSLLAYFSVSFLCRTNLTQFCTTKGNAAVIAQRYEENKS